MMQSERQLFLKERGNGYYHPITYYTSRIFLDVLLLRIIPPIILGLIIYYTVGLRTDSIWFLYKFLTTLVLFNITSSLCTSTISIIFSNVSTCNLLATTVMLTEMLFSGLLLNKNTIPHLNFLNKFSFFGCALEMLIVNEVNGLMLKEDKFGIKVDVPGAVILDAFGFDSLGYFGDLGVLGALAVLFYLGGYLWMYWFVKERK